MCSQIEASAREFPPGMATWNEVLSEITALQLPNGMFDFDSVSRRKYLAELAAVTGRPAVVYATAFLDANPQKARSNVSLHILETKRACMPSPAISRRARWT